MNDIKGKELKTGQIVKIEGGYFKADNGYHLIVHSPGDPTWLGSDYSLIKCSKDGKESTAKYRHAFYPLMVSTNSREKRILAKEHNKNNATIEIIGKLPAYEVKTIQRFGWRNDIEQKEIVTGDRYKELQEAQEKGNIKMEIIREV